MTYGLQPYEEGKMFLVNPYGAFFFTSCSDLDNFVHKHVVSSNVHHLDSRHVLIALEDIPYTSGRAHDEQHGDGFVFMAPKTDPLSGYKLPTRKIHFVRKSRNGRDAILTWQMRRKGQLLHREGIRPKFYDDTPVQGCH